MLYWLYTTDFVWQQLCESRLPIGCLLIISYVTLQPWISWLWQWPWQSAVVPRSAAPRAQGIHSTVRRDPATAAAHLCGNYVRPSANLWAIGSRRFLWEWDRKDAKFTSRLRKYTGSIIFLIWSWWKIYTLRRKWLTNYVCSLKVHPKLRP